MFHPGELRSVAVREDGRLAALAALYCDRGRLLPVGIALSDYLDVLADPEERPRALSALAWCVPEIPGWEEWSLEELPPGAAALAMPVPTGCGDGSQPQSACPVLDLPLSARRLEAAIPAAKLRKLSASCSSPTRSRRPSTSTVGSFIFCAAASAATAHGGDAPSDGSRLAGGGAMRRAMRHESQVANWRESLR